MFLVFLLDFQPERVDLSRGDSPTGLGTGRTEEGLSPRVTNDPLRGDPGRRRFGPTREPGCGIVDDGDPEEERIVSSDPETLRSRPPPEERGTSRLVRGAGGFFARTSLSISDSQLTLYFSWSSYSTHLSSDRFSVSIVLCSSPSPGCPSPSKPFSYGPRDSPDFQPPSPTTQGLCLFLSLLLCSPKDPPLSLTFGSTLLRDRLRSASPSRILRS